MNRTIEVFADFLAQDDFSYLESAVTSVAAAGVDERYALATIIAESRGVDSAGKDKNFFTENILPSIKPLDAGEYSSDPYYRTVKFSGAKENGAELCYGRYRPFEPFVENDLWKRFDGSVMPRLGYFREGFTYPAVKKDGRIWMTVTPNEINTMIKPIAEAKGTVVALGLGLGYFPFMAARKKEVEKVIVIEYDKDIISLFYRHIAPLMPCANKIDVICEDAYSAVEKGRLPRADVVFCDLWHDPSDGADGYLRLKKNEGKYPGTKFLYWIEDTIRFYL